MAARETRLTIPFFDAAGKNEARIQGVDERGGLAEFLDINRPDLPIYQQYWWIQVASRGARAVEGMVKNGKSIIGYLPYIVNRRRSLLLRGMSPHWSRLGGPAVSRDLSDEEKRKVLRQLISGLPKNISFQFACSSQAADAILIKKAFLGAGFRLSTRITYLMSFAESAEEGGDYQYIADQKDSDEGLDPGVMCRIHKKRRHNIRSANRKLEDVDVSAREFIAFYSENLRAAGIKSYAPLSVARDLIEKGLERGQARIFAVRQKKPAGCADPARLDAAIVCVWDNERCYLWLSTRRRSPANSLGDKPHPDAVKLLIVKAVNHARRLKLIFDVDGFATQSSGELFTKALRFSKESIEERYVFVRTTWAADLVEMCRQALRGAARSDGGGWRPVVTLTPAGRHGLDSRHFE